MAPKLLIASALLFDMDGTLVNSGASVERAWAWWCRRYNLDLSEILAYSHGRPSLATMQHFGQRFAPGMDWQADVEEMWRMEESASATTIPIPGASELLTSLNGPWAVVTSAPRSLAKARILGAGLPLPKILVTANEIKHGKPDPEGFLKAASDLKVDPKLCVVFEDTPPGIDAGLNAGMQVIGLLTTVPANRLNTTNLIRNYHDLIVTPVHGQVQIEFKG